MISGKLITAPDGLKGFDANSIITPQAASLFYSHGYRFAIRYVRRTTKHDYDLTEAEATRILTAGLGLMVVQHVAAEGWAPSGNLGAAYGAVASDEALEIGVPPGAMLWCDLEGVLAGVHARDVIDFCNEWHSDVSQSGYVPGLYVGYGAGLTSQQLYQHLRFTHYWSAYNLNADSFPAVRGVQMKQRAANVADLIPGFTNQNLDVNTTHADTLGDRVVLLTDVEWSP